MFGHVLVQKIQKNATLPAMRDYTPYHAAPQRPHQSSDIAAGMPWTHSLSSHIGMGRAEYEYMQGMLPAAVAHEAGQSADASIGCSDSPYDDAWYAETARHAHEIPDPRGVENQWERLLSDIRGDGHPAETADGKSAECLVGVQPENRVLCEQTYRSAVTPLWVVNSMDWIDVEYVLRRMMQCESIECHAFHTMGYIFFRSCALGHVSAPSGFLQSGAIHRFTGTAITIEITRVHAEGVLEVTCFAEYAP